MTSTLSYAAPTALFDLDETLLDLAAAMAKYAAEWDTLHGLCGDGAAWMMATFGRERFRTGNLERLFVEARGRFRLRVPVEFLVAHYRRRLPELCTIRPDVLRGLRDLRQGGIRVGIVSGGVADVQTSKIRLTGLDKAVDGWTLAAVAGVQKPDLGLFTTAVIEAGGAPSAGGWMVGDEPHKDIVGGHALGFRTIWITNGRPWPSDVPAPDHHVTDVMQAISRIHDQHRAATTSTGSATDTAGRRRT